MAPVTMPTVSPPLRRAIRDGAVIAGLLFAAYVFVIVAPVAGTVGYDAFAYWNVNPADPYVVPVGGLGAFNYSPPIARVFGPFGTLEWPTFLWLWLALLFGNIIWLGRARRPDPLAAGVPAGRPRDLPRQHPPVDRGGDRPRLPLPVDVGLRVAHQGDARDRPALVRRPAGMASAGHRTRGHGRDRRRLARPPGSAVGRLARLHRLHSGGRLRRPVPDRRPALDPPARRPSVLVVWGARTDRRWTVVVAATLALPVLWVSGFAICAALASVPLRTESTVDRRQMG